MTLRVERLVLLVTDFGLVASGFLLVMREKNGVVVFMVVEGKLSHG